MERMSKTTNADDDGRRFYSFAWGGTALDGVVELRHIVDGKVSSHWPGGRDQYQDTIHKLSDGKKDGALYHGAALRKSKKDRTKNGIAGTYVLWAEIDTEKMGWNTNACLRALHNLPYELMPSCVVHSGYGIHCYWKLSEPLTDVPQIEAANQVLAKFVSGDKVWNADRVLRAPSSWNTKYGDKKQARIVWLYPWHKHDASDLVDGVLSLGRVLYDGVFIPVEEADEVEARELENYNDDNALNAAREDRRKTANARGERIWDKCRYGGGLGYVGIHEAALMYTAWRYCILSEPTTERIETIVRDTLEHIERVWRRDAKGEAWDWQREEREVRKMITSWALKWAGLKTRGRSATASRDRNSKRQQMHR